MSGGAYDYLYSRIDSFAGHMVTQDCSYRQKFAEHLIKVARAMHDIEWVDSGDYGPGREFQAIQKVLDDRPNAKTLHLDMLKDVRLKIAGLLEEIKEIIKEAKNK